MTQWCVSRQKIVLLKLTWLKTDQPWSNPINSRSFWDMTPLIIACLLYPNRHDIFQHYSSFCTSLCILASLFFLFFLSQYYTVTMFSPEQSRRTLLCSALITLCPGGRPRGALGQCNIGLWLQFPARLQPHIARCSLLCWPDTPPESCTVFDIVWICCICKHKGFVPNCDRCISACMEHWCVCSCGIKSQLRYLTFEPLCDKLRILLHGKTCCHPQLNVFLQQI